MLEINNIGPASYGLEGDFIESKAFADAFCKDCPAIWRDRVSGSYECPVDYDMSDPKCDRRYRWDIISAHIKEIENELIED